MGNKTPRIIMTEENRPGIQEKFNELCKQKDLSECKSYFKAYPTLDLEKAFEHAKDVNIVKWLIKQKPDLLSTVNDETILSFFTGFCRDCDLLDFYDKCGLVAPVIDKVDKNTVCIQVARWLVYRGYAKPEDFAMSILDDVLCWVIEKIPEKANDIFWRCYQTEGQSSNCFCIWFSHSEKIKDIGIIHKHMLKNNEWVVKKLLIKFQQSEEILRSCFVKCVGRQRYDMADFFLANFPDKICLSFISELKNHILKKQERGPANVKYKYQLDYLTKLTN